MLSNLFQEFSSWASLKPYLESFSITPVQKKFSDSCIQFQSCAFVLFVCVLVVVLDAKFVIRTSGYCAIFSVLTNVFKLLSQFLLRLRPFPMCITPIDIKLTNIFKVLWKFVHCVIIIPIKVHLGAVGVVLCIEIIGRIGSMGGKGQRDFMCGGIEEIRKGVRIT